MKISFLFFFAVMATDWSSRSAVGQSCERITHQMCKGLGYNYTVFPNRFNQRTQAQAMLEMHQFNPLLRNNCSSSLRKFLCSMYMPVCSKTPLPPCRSLCELVKSGCGPVMKRFGIPWPKKITCSDFPDFGDKLCVSSTEEKAGRVCERVTVPMCTGIGYNYTLMPNIFNHDSQARAALGIQQYWPLVESGCSSSLRKFLCSVHTPMCTQTGGTMPPCRSLCEESQGGCEPIMRNYGFSWPTKLNCSSFPVEGGDTSCIAPAQAGSKCEKITIPLCQGISYNYTMYPNRFGHGTQGEAGLEVHQFYPLIKNQCSSSLELFLCTVYAPKCADTLIPPCRSLCERSQSDCQPMMRRFDFPWPASLKCSNFPVEGGDTKCIAPEDDSDVTTTSRPPTTATLVFPQIKTQGSKCEKITLPLCQGISYNYTMYPNRLGHDTQGEAGLEIHQFYPLIKIQCSSSLELFLCTVYAPKCPDTLIPPCRSLCERSQRGCQPMMRRFGFPWPASLNCSNFPVEGGDTKCIAPEDDSDVTTTSRPPTTATLVFPQIKKYRALLSKAQGEFNSPNYPNPYPPKTEYNWIIQLPDSYKVVKITIEKMRLEEDRNCLYDYIIIKDKMLNQVGPRHCGTYRSPYQVPVRGNKAIITFVSDGSTSKAGFIIKYRGLQNNS